MSLTSQQFTSSNRLVVLPVLIALAAIASACYPSVGLFDPYVSDAYRQDQITVVSTVVYDTAVTADGEMVDLVVDIYHPPVDGQPRPTLAILHGGGFFIGDRTIHFPEAMGFAQRGYVVITPTYRLRSSFPDQLLDTAPALDAAADIQVAIKWLRANAATYGVDVNRIGVLGGSSGGAPALLSAQTTDLTQGRWAGPESHIPNAVWVMGTTVLPTMFNEGHITSDTIAAPALIQHFEVDSVSGSTGADAEFACLVWASAPSTHRCTPTIFPGEGHYIRFFPWDQFARDNLMPFLAVELDLANARTP